MYEMHLLALIAQYGIASKWGTKVDRPIDDRLFIGLSLTSKDDRSQNIIKVLFDCFFYPFTHRHNGVNEAIKPWEITDLTYVLTWL